MQVELIDELKPELPVYLVIIGGQHRYYQCRSSVELFVYFKKFYPGLSYELSGEVPFFIHHLLNGPFYLLTSC